MNELTKKLTRKIMVVSHGMPPAHTGSSVVIANLASQFRRQEITVAGEKWPAAGTQATQQMPDNFHYVWSQPVWPSNTAVNVARLIAWPLILIRLVRLFRRQRCQAVLGVFPSEYYLCLAYLVALLYRVPFYSYFHNTYLDNRQGWRRITASWIQKRVFSRSRIIYVMSRGMESHLKQQYQEYRFESLVHIFEAASTSAQPVTKQRCRDTTLVRVAFLGNINSSNLDAFQRFCRTIQDMNVEFYTYTSLSDQTLNKLGIDLQAIKVVKIPMGAEIDHLQRQDILFLPHGLTGGLNPVEYQTIFPTKTIPYLLAKRPILAHSPANSFLTTWLRDFDCAEIVSRPSESELKTTLQQLIDDRDRQRVLVQNARVAADTFSPDKVACFFARTFNETVCA